MRERVRERVREKVRRKEREGERERTGENKIFIKIESGRRESFPVAGYSWPAESSGEEKCNL